MIDEILGEILDFVRKKFNTEIEQYEVEANRNYNDDIIGYDINIQLKSSVEHIDISINKFS